MLFGSLGGGQAVACKTGFGSLNRHLGVAIFAFLLVMYIGDVSGHKTEREQAI